MPRYTMPPINLGSPPADYAWYTPSTQQSMHSTHPAVYAADTGSGLCTYSGCHQTTHTHVHKATTLRRVGSLYNSTILHTKTTRQRHIYVKQLWESDEECEAVENEDGCSQGRRSALIEGHFLRSYEQRCFVIPQEEEEEGAV